VTEPLPTQTRVEVPFMDLGAMHAPLRDAILRDLAAIIDESAFVNGPHVAAFEDAFASYCGTRHCVGMASGLDALRLALVAAELKRGSEVVVPASTFVATLEAVTQAGLRPVLADVREDDYGLDPAAAAAAIGPRTSSVVPVHLYGQMCDMRALREVAERTGVAIVEDAAQAHGASRDGLRSGTVGHTAAFSFYPAKNLGAMGDAGALVTHDDALARRARALREHGQRDKYEHEREGYTARLDTFQAAVLARKLPHLDAWSAERKRIASFYSQALNGVGDVVLPAVPAGSDPVWHLYVVRTAEPGTAAAFLRARGIATGRHYPTPPHLSPAYRWLGYRAGAFPVSEALSRECLSLPLFPGMTEEQVDAVVDALAEYFAHGA
jgi:dTDP-3-amino-3,4,6-trideoxy-alpha-D-glucose transaminase